MGGYTLPYFNILHHYKVCSICTMFTPDWIKILTYKLSCLQKVTGSVISDQDCVVYISVIIGATEQQNTAN